MKNAGFIEVKHIGMTGITTSKSTVGAAFCALKGNTKGE
jgi:hypothetical protein